MDCLQKNNTKNQRTIWFDLRKFSPEEQQEITHQLDDHVLFNGFVVSANQLDTLPSINNPECTLVITIENDDDKQKTEQFLQNSSLQPKLVLQVTHDTLIPKHDTRAASLARKYQIVDNRTLLQSIENPDRYDYLVFNFRDPTNIPLELVLASVQGCKAKVVKEISETDFVDDAVVCLGIMEHGADGVIYSPNDIQALQQFVDTYKLHYDPIASIGADECIVIESRHIGMGYRACIDLATLFEPNEGLLIGSTSHGGILCCPEVFHLPYMELRPFRVNAGGIHSYIFHHDESTNYLSELKVGHMVSVVSLDGSIRKALVGRIKVEVRPLRMIAAKFDSGNEVNVVLQDDWHVRVYGSAGEPLHVSEIKAGDKLIGLDSAPGRHVGIKIAEKIVEQ